MIDMREIERKAGKMLSEEHIWVDEIYQYEELPVLVVEVDGDWKHDHLRCQHLMEEKLGANFLKKEVTRDDGSDSYGAKHYYIFNNLW